MFYHLLKQTEQKGGKKTKKSCAFSELSQAAPDFIPSHIFPRRTPQIVPPLPNERFLTYGEKTKTNKNNWILTGIVQLKFKFHPFTTPQYVDGGSRDLLPILISQRERIPPSAETIEAYGGHVRKHRKKQEKKKI